MHATSIHWFLIIIVLISVTACRPATEGQSLPYLGTREPVERQVDGQTVIDTVYQKAPDFQLINQDSITIDQTMFKGGMYVVDFFFTSCPTICPTMSRNMLKLYEKFNGNPKVHFLSHTIDPKYDTPSVLKAYAQKLGVEGDQWQFVTGTKETIYGLAPEYMVLRPEEDKDQPGGFIHQGWFILIDHNGHFRGAYDGTQDQQVENLSLDMDILLQEINP